MNEKTQNRIECEVRGPITWSDFCEIKDLIEKEFGKLKNEKELVIFIRGKDKDLRLKITSGGCFLVLKKTIHKKTNSKIEKEIKIPHLYISNVLEILNNLGYKMGLLSFSNSYKTKRGSLSIAFKFGTKIGDFFEIEEIVNSKKEVKEAFKRIMEIAKKFDLLVWDKKTYEKVRKRGWKNEVFRSIKYEILPLVFSFLKEIKS